MNRKIKFRGKEVNTGRWYYGSYLAHRKQMGYPTKPNNDIQHLILMSGSADWGMLKPIDMAEVDPETVGEYTGLKDKNGKEIYEGDIIRGQANSKRWLISFSGCEYIAEYIGGLKGYTLKENYSLSVLIEMNKQKRSEFTVIGNKFENPELLS